jgi:5-methylcytosine-specific restriction endonuclease McrA
VRRDRQAKARTAQARAKANRWHPFYKTAGWKKLRRRVLANAEHRCQRCGAEGVPLDVHHVRPVEQYPELALELENLIAVCRPLSQAGLERRDRGLHRLRDRGVVGCLRGRRRSLSVEQHK